MRRLYFTADIDRDVNIQIPGQAAAGSLDRGSGTAPRFSSSEDGLGVLLDILDEVGMRGTLFFEGRTAETIDCSRASGHCIGMHGYDHEDLATLSDDALEYAVTRSFQAVSDNVGRPVCSRAPYMSADGRVIAEFLRHGIVHDSSFYSMPGEPCGEYPIGGMTEHPVPKARDPDGRTIAAYLWPMHEGRRRPEDYIRMAESIDGPMVLADHSWHLVEAREGGVMSPEKRDSDRRNVLAVVEGILDLGFEPAVLTR